MNKYFMLKKMVSIILLCSMMLQGGCTVISGFEAMSHYLNKNDRDYKNEYLFLLITTIGVSVDYLWYNQAQKYQDQGESKSKAYGKGSLVALGVFVVGLYLILLGRAYYDEKIKKKY